MTEGAAKGAGDVVGVLAIGGTHVTAALVDRRSGLVPGSERLAAIDSSSPADELIGGFSSAMAEVNAPPEAPWVVATPGPFDYRRGIGLFEGVGKFDALFGVDVACGLHAALPRLTGAITFVNDADAFAVGEWRHGVASSTARCVGITLGTGVGSSFLDHGVPVTDGPTVPPDGRVHRLKIGDLDLEDVVSRRAILGRYRAGAGVTGSVELDVRDVFDSCRRGDDWAERVLADAFRALGVALAPWLQRFAATLVAVGGAMTGSWDLIDRPLRQGLIVGGAPPDLEVRRSADTERSALLGAASFERSAWV